MTSPGSRKLRSRADKSNTESKFDKLRRLRATGESALSHQSDDSADDQLYMNVDEDEYRTSSKYANDRLDDFVVDDEDGSYNVEDDIGGESSKAIKKQTLLQKPKKLQKQQDTKKEKRLDVKDKRSLNAMFKDAHLRTPKKGIKDTSQDDEEFMASLISGLEAPVTPSKSAAKRRHQQTPDTSSYSVRRRMAAASTKAVTKAVIISEPVHEPPVQQQQITPQRPAKKQRQDDDDPFVEPEIVIKAEPGTDEQLDELDQLDDDALLGGLEALHTSVDTPPSDTKPQEPKLLYAAEDSTPQGTDWTAVQQGMAAQTQLLGPESTISEPLVLNGGQPTDVYLYWLDASESNGTVYLFGKLQQPSGAFESCCIRVTNIERNVFLLPRIDNKTGERFAASSVHSEFESLAISHGVRSFACKPVQRRYAFDANVPTSAEYLKVVYGFAQPVLPADLSGSTFERILGTSYSALELLLLKRRMMGPGWLTAKRAKRVNDAHDRVSWCRHEFIIDDPKLLTTMADEAVAQAQLPRTPPLTTMTLSVKTVVNQTTGANEVVAASVLVHRDSALDDATPAAQRQGEQQTLVRPLTGVPMPADFERLRLAQARRGLSIEYVRNETTLLNLLTAMLKRVDPDILAAHNFYGFDLDVLLHRMQALRTDGWSALGRLRRRTMPRLDSNYGARQVVAGRVVCDTYLAAKDLVRAKSYSLGSLAMQELGIRREDMPFDRIPEYFAQAPTLLRFLRHAAFDAFLAAALMLHLHALPLTRQLTALAGNLWARTLMGARAERNEFLLLHEFYRAKFIRPDKPVTGYGAAAGAANGKTAKPSLHAEIARAVDQAPNDDDNDDDAPAAAAAATKSGRRKPAYLGGLVLEPKRGFYDRFVLLLDFNSLYPSIIQEFNICFTTVRTADPDSVPEPPQPDLPQGILPRLLRTLVDRRRQVKQLLRQPNLAPEESAQLNIRQQALKLTANSMYGCLGFTHSRFYAKPLAMLITSRGREILQATRDLALADGLEVIYGDTDSIMIATRCATLAQAYDIGAQFKRRANERYKLLELDIDGVFKRLLLLKKKKYAALQIVNPETHQGPITTKLESKGLDLVRRDWCELSHEVSAFVLDRLFADPQKSQNSSQDQQQQLEDDDCHDDTAAITAIHDHLSAVAQAVRANQVPLDRFAIHKGLTKAPEAYPDKKSQPHVQVALRLRQKGATIRAGDTVPYIICDPRCPAFSSESSSTGSYAERARHPDEIRESNGQLYPDFEWYLNQQVLPPCARLLEPLPGTDMPTLARHLGLDASRYRTVIAQSTSYDPEALRTLDSQIPDSERFKFARPFLPTCPECKKPYCFDGIARQNSSGLQSGLICAHCSHLPAVGFLANQLSLQIRSLIREYYAIVMQCDEPSCRLKTRVLTVTGSRCLRPHCSGTLHEIFSDKMLYHQLQYFAALLNIDRSAIRLECTATELRVLRDKHIEHFKRLAMVVDMHLSVSARRFVDLGSLFSFCQA
ncbi:DNA-directed DNA polymerase alpha catalytic subunit pol1 [Coemansia sp. RSA 485]|nr:DNA-directed DNA polymerase alpha catalytic subunit pol1 [Coemansia sp. RSA 485]